MRILLYHRLNIGDLILASPALQAFKAENPGATIGLVTNDFVAPVARRMPRVDACWSYAKFAGASPPEWRLLRELRAFRPDVTIGLSPNVDRRLATRVALFKGGIGFGEGLLYRLAYRERCLPLPHEAGHVAQTLAALFGLPPGQALPDCRLTVERSPLPRYAALLYLDARKPSNRPSAEQVIALARALASRIGRARIAVVGVPHGGHPSHPQDSSLSASVRRALDELPGCDFPDVTNVEDLLGLFAGADSVIAPDGGAMHMAAAAGCAVVGLFGDVSPGVWGPRSARSVALQAPSRKVPDISPQLILDAWERLRPTR